MPKVVLFDIDGTLCLTGGAGVRAMNRVCEEVLGTAAALTDVPVAGRTDRIILQDAFAREGRELDADMLEAFRARYVVLLREEIKHPGRGAKAVMPGVRDLLDVLSAREDVFLGLVTGNFEEGARIKLEYFDLWRFFKCGAFGDDAADRNALVPFALRRAADCGLTPVSSEHVFVVGDTPLDVACAHAVGAKSVAVATGSFTAEQLRDSGAHEVFRDLSDMGAFLALL
jgi:phosphoglycolate phosphatase-like HAD superfamily hydrolase